MVSGSNAVVGAEGRFDEHAEHALDVAVVCVGVLRLDARRGRRLQPYLTFSEKRVSLGPRSMRERKFYMRYVMQHTRQTALQVLKASLQLLGRVLIMYFWVVY